MVNNYDSLGNLSAVVRFSNEGNVAHEAYTYNSHTLVATQENALNTSTYNKTYFQYDVNLV